MSVVGMTSFAGMGTAVGVLQGIQSALAGFTAANEGASEALLPPGSEGASAMAMTQQRASSAAFASMFTAGIEQMMELNGSITTSSTATEVADAGNAVMSLV